MAAHLPATVPHPVRLSIGLTGGIGSGKSTVAAMLRDLGAAVIDTDALAHQLTAPGGAAMPAIVGRFGTEVVTPEGALDRPRMRERVFADPQARQALEAILHPLISAATEAAVAALPADQPVVFDVPLLVESLRSSPRWRERVGRILVVDCTPKTQIARVQARNGWPREQIERILTSQARRDERAAVADAVLLNDGIDLDALRTRVTALWQTWTAAHPATPPPPPEPRT